MTEFPASGPSIERVRAVAQTLTPRVIRTPSVPWAGLDSPIAGELWVKLELLQRTGSFKARGALNSLLQLLDVGKGVVAFSAGNHAIAVAWASRELGFDATVVMPRSANPARVAKVEQLGARIVYGDTVADLLAIVERLQLEQGRSLIHPFDGVPIVEGTATVGLELSEDVSGLDAVYVPVGGGGLIAGVASAVKQLSPNCRVVGVEPEGADGMRQSLAAGAPIDKVEVSTIADSLGAPMHRAYTYSLIEQYVDDIVTVSDNEMRRAMSSLFNDMKLAVEPACASTLAALTAAGQAGNHATDRVLMVACGSNLDEQTWYSHIQLGKEMAQA